MFAWTFQYGMLNGVAAYDDFAWFYNRYWNEEFHSIAFPLLGRIWLSRVPPGARILDVCCGTGYLAGLLAERGYCVCGFDASAEMVRHARQNVPQGEFYVGDAAEFRVAGTYDAAVSTFDSLNHLLETDALEAALRNVACSLQSGGWFAFDMLLEDAYKTDWADGFRLVRDDHVLTITDSGYDDRTRIASCTISMSRLIEGAWHPSDVIIRERYFTSEEIGSALDRAGFGEVMCYAAADLGMGGQLGEGRTFFVARKWRSAGLGYR
jgi:SAM-dependent methyltransferase